MSRLRYTFGLPASTADDLASRELKIVVDWDTSSPYIIPLPANATTYQHTFEKGKIVRVTLVDIDTSGNRSLPSTELQIDTIDTVPPSQPAQVTIVGSPVEVP